MIDNNLEIKKTLSQTHFVNIEQRNNFTQSDFAKLVTELDEIKTRKTLKPEIPIHKLSSKVSNNIVTSCSEPVPDCSTCGGCCAYPLCVSVKAFDTTPQTHYWQITNKSGDIVVDQFMRRAQEKLTCIALAGKLSEKVNCQIYENRPQVCRDFEAGSDKCHAIRRTYGIEPPLSSERVLEANLRIELLKTNLDPSQQLLYAEITPYSENEKLAITAIAEDGSRKVIHIYDSQQEKWLQSEFIGLTLIEAYYLIQSKRIIE